ncbi:melatonin receptor type 1B-B-like isoform X2 [Lineus longissimus]|uniref:melatonin receptor type 1B-B-like isoform X2 n=1 Tax=Lineus longissimus TaxID=88925 RepID=UPI00315D9C04
MESSVDLSLDDQLCIASTHNASGFCGQGVNANHATVQNASVDNIDTVDAVYVMIFGIFGGTLGNILMLMVIGLDRKLWTVPNTFVVSIAISDLLVTAEAFPLIFVNNIRGRNILAVNGDGELACKFQCAVHILSVSVSLLGIMAVAINRYLCVCRVGLYKRRFGMRTAILLNVFLWTCSCAVTVIAVWYDLVSTKYIPSLSSCGFQHNLSILYVYVSNFTFIYMPMIVTLICYINIYRALSRSTRRFSKGGSRIFRRQDSGATGCAKCLPPVTKRDIQTIKVLFLTYAAFVICWLPYTFMSFIAVYGTKHLLAYKITVRMCLSNSCANSVVYGIFNRRFRKGYKKIICCEFFRFTRNGSPSTSPTGSWKNKETNDNDLVNNVIL